MKKIILGFIILTTCYFLFATITLALSFPKPVGFVNDFAGLYSEGFKNSLENNLSNFEKNTQAEIAVATVTSLDGNDIDTYAPQLFENWKIGKKGQDNGLLLLISKNDRKIRIEVGYGLEPYITDGRAGDIIRNQMSPEFKSENYEKGTLSAVTSVEKYISDKDIAPTDVPASTSGESFGSWIGILVVIIYVLFTYLASFLGRTKEIWPGGVLGAVLGGIGGIFVASILGLIFGAVVFGLLGLFLDFVLTKNYQVRKKKGLPTGFWTTWGGFGGKGGSGGFGGGGFGGFGGGSSGGGGASGGW